MWRELLTEQNIHIVSVGGKTALDTKNKWTLIDSLLSALCKKEGLTPELHREISRELTEREKTMSTGIGEQMAIPHAVVEGTDRFMTQCAVIQEGIEFESIDFAKTFIVVLLVAPKSSLSEHLKVMAEIARIFYQSENRQKVIAAHDASAALAAILAAK